MYSRQQIGLIGETLALHYLLDKNYTLIEKNARMKWGEIDLILKKENKICFVEVKTRVGILKGSPYEAVNYRKQVNLKRSIDYYIHQNKLEQYKHSLDVVSVILDSKLKPFEIKFYQNVIY